jgi:SEC-C motif
MRIPAFCNTCGTAFYSGIRLEGINTTILGGNIGPCPNCGGTGHLPSGIFNFIGSTIEILSAPQRTFEELSHLSALLREAKSKQQSNEQVAAQIKQELPGLSSLADLLPKNNGELWGFLAVVLAAIQLLTQEPQTPQNITINVSQVVQQTLINSQAVKPKSQATPQTKRVGRNNPCTCGSGKRYKKCCGNLK